MEYVTLIAQREISKYGERAVIESAIQSFSMLNMALEHYRQNPKSPIGEVSDAIADASIRLRELELIFNYGGIMSYKQARLRKMRILLER